VAAFVAGVLLFLRLGEGAVFGDGDSSALAERARYGWSFSFAFKRDCLPRPGGSMVVSMVIVVTASGSPSSMRSRLVEPDFSFLCQRRSGSGRRSFSVLGASWRLHGIGSCGVSNAWCCIVALRIWQVDLSLTSLFVVVESGGVHRCCVKILVGVYL
jgi:hypothetical protein